MHINHTSQKYVVAYYMHAFHVKGDKNAKITKKKKNSRTCDTLNPNNLLVKF